MLTRKEVLDKTTNVNYLRGQIKSLEFKLGRRTHPLYKNAYPEEWHKKLKWLAKQYGSNYKFNRESHHGMFYFYSSEILLGLNGNKGLYNTRPLIATFCHELAHRIQQTIVEKARGRKVYKRSFSNFKECLQYERAAERLAYFLCKEYFSGINFHHKYFSAYQKEKDLKWLEKHHNYERR